MHTSAPRLLFALFATGVLFVGGSVLTSCGSTPDTPGAKADDVDNWIDNPGNIRDVLAVVGSAPILGNEAAARTRAETNGRGQMAATLQTRIQSLMSNWFKETGDMLKADSVSSYVNDEGMVRQITNAEIGGARAIKYAKRGNTQYVLMVLDDPKQFVENVGAAVKDRALRDDTLLKTEGMKTEFERKMNELIEKDSENLQEKRDEFLRQYQGASGSQG